MPGTRVPGCSPDVRPAGSAPPDDCVLPGLPAASVPRQSNHSRRIERTLPSRASMFTSQDWPSGSMISNS